MYLLEDPERLDLQSEKLVTNWCSYLGQGAEIKDGL